MQRGSDHFINNSQRVVYVMISWGGGGGCKSDDPASAWMSRHGAFRIRQVLLSQQAKRASKKAPCRSKGDAGKRTGQKMS